MSLFRSTLSIVLGSWALGVAPAVAANFYTVQPLPFTPLGLNNRGEVVGGSFVWSGGSVVDLRSLPGANSSPLVARSINDSGTILGDGLTVNRSTTTQSSVRSQVFLSNQRSISDIGLVGTSFCTEFCDPTSAVGINNRGQFAFNLDVPAFDGYRPAYVQNSDGTRISVFGSDPATGINNLGQVIGSTFARGRSGPGVGRFWENGNTVATLTSTGYCSPFSGTSCFSTSVATNGVNDRGQVVGVGPAQQSNDAPFRALFWDDPKTNTVGRDLGGLGGIGPNPTVIYGVAGNVSSLAHSINNAGQIVGFAYAPNGDRRAVIWEEGQLMDLNSRLPLDSGWTLISATQINEQGQIIGTGIANGQEQGYLLTPEAIPEPDSTIVTMGGAGVFVAIAWWKRRRRG